MSFFAALVPTWRHHLLTSGVVTGFLALTIIPSFSVAARAEDSIPQLGSRDFGWNANFWDFQLDPPPGSGHGPMKTDPNFPYNSQIQNGGFSGGPLQPPIVNTKDPILKPWAAAQMQATNEEVLSGKKGLPFISQSRCWPGGVPGQLLFLQPMYFLQTPNAVWMIWERDHFARRIYLTDKHSEHVKPSWFGESIGHYEGGDTLVVDTIGLAAGKYRYIDSFRAPHTEKLHVVERFTISPDGRALTAISKIVRYLKRLETETMVTTSTTREATHITICNYDKYAFGRNTDDTPIETQTGTPAVHSRYKEEEGKKVIKKEGLQPPWKTKPRQVFHRKPMQPQSPRGPRSTKLNGPQPSR
jgi:hypothetical protein